ncbi:MAG: energy transducer TonB [Candidatus Acidiferrales bacterium]
MHEALSFQRLATAGPKTDAIATIMASAVHFLLSDFSLMEGYAMKLKTVFAGLGLMAVLGGTVVVVTPRALAQDATTDAAKRKVRVKVTPEYPDLARQMNVTGKVKIEAKIAADGHVADTRVVGGSPLLVNAALDALKKWRFEPAPKETTEVVEFTFNGTAN